MVFRTDNIKRKFKYKSTVNVPSSSSPTPTAYKSAGQPNTPSQKQPYQGPQQQVKKGKGTRNYNNRQTNLPTTLEQAVNSNKLVITPKSKNFFDHLSSLSIDWGGVAAADTGRGNSNFNNDIVIQKETDKVEDKPAVTPPSTATDPAIELKGFGPSYGDRPNTQPNWSLSGLFDFSGGSNNRYELDKAASAAADKYYSDQGAISAPGGTYLNEDGTGINIGTTPKEIAMDEKAANIGDIDYSGEQFPLYHGAGPKVNVGSDGMVRHDGYKNLDTTNETLNKQNTVKNTTYIPGVTKAMGISSNVSMKLFSNGSTKSNSISDSINFQNNSRVHTGMVKEWQTGFLTSSSRDKTSASHWLNSQLGKIDSMEGTDKNKKMFKKDLQGRFDGLFMNRTAPFQSPQTLKQNNTSDGLKRQQERNEAKRLQALQASENYFNSSSITNWKPSPPPPSPDKKTKPGTPTQNVNLLDDYTSGNFGQA